MTHYQISERCAAVHEAGHLVVATVLGYKVRAYIYDVSDHSSDESPVGGDMSFACNPGMPPPPFSISYAGVVAEYLSEQEQGNRSDLCGNAHDIIERIDGGELLPSVSDRQGFPTGYAAQLKAVEQSLRILLEHREFHAWAVDRLISDRTITDGMAADYYNQHRSN